MISSTLGQKVKDILFELYGLNGDFHLSQILDRLEPEESVFIDDRPVNIKGAETCGIHGIVFRSYEQAKKELDEFLKEF